MRKFIAVVTLSFGSVVAGAAARGAELLTLTAENWPAQAPAGKEADAIIGDYVLRNDRIAAVIANPIADRNANMTVKNVGGAVIDLTTSDRPNDQLSVFYPGGGGLSYRFDRVEVENGGQWSVAAGDPGKFSLKAKRIRLHVISAAGPGKPVVATEYTLSDGKPFLVVKTTFRNGHTKPVEVDIADGIRTDKIYAPSKEELAKKTSPWSQGRTFVVGEDAAVNLLWAYDRWWGQAYGVVPAKHRGQRAAAVGGKGAPPLIRYTKENAQDKADDKAKPKDRVALAPGESYELVRRVFPTRNLFEAVAVARSLKKEKTNSLVLEVRDSAGPVAGADIAIVKDGETAPQPWARTGLDGKATLATPLNRPVVSITALGRTPKVGMIDMVGPQATIELDRPGIVAGEVTDERGGPIPCKVQFRGVAGTADPFFGPDTYEHAVQNLHYSHTGKFEQEIPPGKYEALVSYGPEYDAVIVPLEVRRNERTTLRAKLIRTVHTAGWVSADFHSHSTPSGDNTCSQLGRVLNLLCEHVEFAPCTEHNRITNYTPHLQALGVESLMATCPGMELTGAVLPVNHQNAFPLLEKPGQQDGGGPRIDANPIVQIERLAMWDNASDKLVQQNHPDLQQIAIDSDLDGKPDGKYAQMFGFMDVMEIHPLPLMLTRKLADDKGKRVFAASFHWLQLLNQGHRIPGVVNTDAHYSFHGSGFQRNYIRAASDKPSELKVLDLVHESERGHLTMTTAPFLEVELTANGDKSRGIPGDDVVATGGQATLKIRVQCANWYDIDRVQVLLNGVATPELNFTRQANADKFGSETVRFEQAIPLTLKSDTHVIVCAVGEKTTLGAVYGPEYGKLPPIAVSNPIFVDVDGGGFKSNGDWLGVTLPTKELPEGQSPPAAAEKPAEKPAEAAPGKKT